jgi:DNA-binding beta-propeller fold protein YncE
MNQSIRHVGVKKAVQSFLIAILAMNSMTLAASVDRSDLNGDGVVNEADFVIFKARYLADDPATSTECNFYSSSRKNERYFRRVTSDRTNHYASLLRYVGKTYNCALVANAEGQEGKDDKSDLNDDGLVDLADLAIFSETYLVRDWNTVNWCEFHAATLASEDFEGEPTKYYRRHFGRLLNFMYSHFYCDGPPPPPSELAVENSPRFLVRMARGPHFDSDYYVSDPLVGSVFIYDSSMELKAELKALDRPLGVAIDSQGKLLVGNDGRDNVEVYDPATGQLLAIIGEGTIKMPTAIALDALGNIYVTDAKSDTVRVFDSNYVPLRTIGQRGPDEGGLRFPVDTVVFNMQEVFVADQGNDRLQVYALDGTWLRSFTFEGTQGQDCNFMGVCQIPGAPAFSRLKAMDLDALGRLHVLDNLWGAVLVFDTATGNFEGQYGEHGHDIGQLSLPMDVLVMHSGHGMVTSGDGDRIEFFAIP